MTEPLGILSDVDDCWNRIGIRGDKSCPQLPAHVHCRNCPVYAAAAKRILDRLPPQMEDGDDAAAGTQERGDLSSLLVFRVQREWLALPTRALDEVAGMRRILGLPHRRDPAMLGVANVRGTLTVCVSLPRLLGLDAMAQARERPAAARMLILGGAGRAVVLPVDEVEGIHSVDLGRLEPLPATVEGASLKYSRGVARCGGRAVGVLDETLLMQALERSLA
ncbi:purine-binding chemotaxis protein CheW [Achromobacter denitrificans]|uniref:Chemotaxis protein CheW n=1 Tax=Achromobacter denitrificans TaxID=32002 RepID=A0A3R9GR90_ACHDE|nr:MULTISPECIES: chemotaxis protein CheW [Achromobacter]ASC67323.1 chemotaxis protein CheW [Achromobacter denitrificans]MBV2159071.1 chemotaxis protein CheW [Achromobacter denitrificans]MDF3851547.1 chemotaxis protein CheW [Achromobacter denitrificans]MDF3857465.1 chemotaxis protein CheW [Achromobacter denitrificans]MDF3943487.1 chemotaxis protein CheW [Achromobacter denitrificans]